MALRYQSWQVMPPSDPFDIASVMPLSKSGHWDCGWMAGIRLTRQNKPSLYA
jgi:hypothetical protein